MKALKNQIKLSPSSQKFLNVFGFLLTFSPYTWGMSNFYKNFGEKAGQATIASALVMGGSSPYQACANLGVINNLIDKDKKFVKDNPDVDLKARAGALRSSWESVYVGSETAKYAVPVETIDFATEVVYPKISDAKTQINKVNPEFHDEITQMLSHDSLIITEDPAYDQLVTNRYADFLEKVAQDPDIKRYQSSWSENGTLLSEEKQAFMEKIHELHAESFGYKKVPIHRLSERGEDEQGRMKSSDGYFSFGRNDITYDDMDKDSNYKAPTPGGVVNTITHESQHAWHQHLSVRVEEFRLLEGQLQEEMGVKGQGGVSAEQYREYQERLPDYLKENISGGWNDAIDNHLMKGGALRRAAEIFEMAQDHYIDVDDNSHAYRQNTWEVEAFAVGDVIERFIPADPELQRQAVKAMREHADNLVMEDSVQYTDEQLNMTCSELANTL